MIKNIVVNISKTTEVNFHYKTVKKLFPAGYFLSLPQINENQ